MGLRSTGNQFTFLERASIPVIVSAATTTVRPIAFQTLNANGAKYVFHFTAVVSGLLMYARHLNEKETRRRQARELISWICCLQAEVKDDC